MFKYDLMKYATNAAFGYASILAYDVLVNGYELNGGFAMSDATSFAISSVLTNFSGDVLSSVVPYLYEGNLASMLTYPLLNGIIYMTVFDMMTNNKYPGNRDSTGAFLVGSISNLVIRYVESPVLNLFGMVNYH